MRSEFVELKQLIDYIQVEHTAVTNEWLCGTSTRINLKQSQVVDIDIDGAIYKNIMDYVQFLIERTAEISLRLSSVCSCKVTARVKTRNSIEYKIQNYKKGHHAFGKVPINKCINDLFGVRVLLETPVTFEEICKFVEDTYQGKYKCRNSSKLEYKAVHLYFKENNQSFQWELQIWRLCDAENNLASHKKYKQEYTTWEKESREGGIIDG